LDHCRLMSQAHEPDEQIEIDDVANGEWKNIFDKEAKI
jgi:hypothetical protein